MKKIIIYALLLMLVLITGCMNKHTVTFDSNGGTIVETQKVEHGTPAKKPIDPVKDGVDFVGWFTIEDIEWNFADIINSDLLLIAKYDDDIIKYTVTFIDYDGTVLKEEQVQEGKSATAPTDPIREGYTFKGWSETFDEVTSDLEIKAIYDHNENEFTVTFMNYNGKILKEEVVKKGENATPPENPTREGYVFIGWKGEYTNVQSNITIKANYVSVDVEYDISYVMNNGVWGFSSKSEGVYYFLKDFYQFVSPKESLEKFIFGDDVSNSIDYLGTWKDYIGGYYGDNNKLLYNNNLEENNEQYFFNSSLYKEKWAPLGKWIASLNDRFNGSDYYYGTLDFYRYITNNPDQYINVYGQNFYSFPEMNLPFKTYKYSEEGILLPTPLNEGFKGWYINSDFSGEPITHIPAKNIGEFEVYACWDTTITYEVSFNSDGGGTFDPITVNFNDEISLPTPSKEGFTFIGWYIGNKYLGETLKFTYPVSVTLVAKYRNNTITLEELKYDDKAVKYRNTNTSVLIPSDYVQPTEQLRATWVSSYASTFTPSPYEPTMKANLTKILNQLEEYNMNCMIFHIRTTNNAFYQTDLAPINPDYGTYKSFEQWDYLEWLIDECHKRGIEFHAWLNPYRIKAYGYPADATTKTVAADYVDYPKNPASNPDNILLTYRSDGTKGAILNPAKQEVQDYIVDVCLEVMEKYDVDAIHFDDYFYAQMTSGIQVLSEPDQEDFRQFVIQNPNCGYSYTSATDKKQWRRDNIDNFIYQLSTEMTKFNKENGRGVQLGISPTGIYRNGDGSVSSGSNTAGQEHYSSYLFCDTVKWIKNEWIDYIMPQSYWAFTHKVAGYADVMDWWDKVVDGTRVNLYSGLGLYMSISGGNYSWGVQPYEVSNQILYTTKLKNVKGVSFYSYLSLVQVNSSSTRIAHDGLMRVKNEYWTAPVPTPKTMADQYKK